MGQSCGLVRGVGWRWLFGDNFTVHIAHIVRSTAQPIGFIRSDYWMLKGKYFALIMS